MKVLSLMNVSMYPVGSGSAAHYEMMNLCTGYWVIDGTVPVYRDIGWYVVVLGWYFAALVHS